MRRDDVLATAMLSLLCCAPAFAESSSPSPPPFGGCIGILVIYICVKRRTQEIGGWLLYFYIQLYVGAVAVLGAVAMNYQNYLPSSWSAAPSLYWLFLASTVPGQLVMPAQLVLAEMLRRSRDPRYLSWLRAALWIDLLSVAAALAIDAEYFRDNLIFDGLALAWPVVLLPYLYVSKRVNRVFVLKDWVTPAAVPSLGIAGGPTGG